jgi:hypothetical protein
MYIIVEGIQRWALAVNGSKDEGMLVWNLD